MRIVCVCGSSTGSGSIRQLSSDEWYCGFGRKKRMVERPMKYDLL